MSLHLVTGYAGREHVTSADHGSFNIAFVGAGEYVFNRSDNFEATIIDNETVRIGSGDLLMQGRHIRQMENTQTTLTFDSGVSGLYRKDMIVAEYRKDAATMVESALFNVIKGTPALTEEEAVLPTYTHGDITEEESDRLNQMPLYEVDFEEGTLARVVPLFTLRAGYDAEIIRMQNQIMLARELAVDYTLYAANWVNNNYSLESDYPVSQYNIINFLPNTSTTDAMRKAWAKADCAGYNPTQNVLTAHKTVPTIDIVGTLFIRTAGEV